MSMSTKIAKACDPCRLRKRDISASVSQLPPPGSGLSVGALSANASPTTQWPDHLSAEESEQAVQHEVYHSVTETHLSSTPTDSSQLFYGPSSCFAFLQQIHRGILPTTDHGKHEGNKTQPGLDTFMQSSIFFGTPPRISQEAIRSESIQRSTISREIAQDFLQGFKITSHYRLPFYTIEELDSLLQMTYDSRYAQNIPPQTKASFLAILAIGALSTPQTDLAETLFTEARREAVSLEDAVTLQTLQLSLLFADYQVNIGRPTSTYMHLGMACRKALAFGLYISALSTRLDSLTLQKHQTTLWSLYFYETYQALTLGRQSSLRWKDITCPFPTEPLPIVRLCRIAKIMEDAAEGMYGTRANSLRQLYVMAEELRGRLGQFAREYGIASAQSGTDHGFPETRESMTLHNYM
ncbi:uncharacterized protein FPRO_15963 [Fusarium proliferatum ET1]|uniref:Xylanolytic transcriptional activator regulatory domain-containing protein n=1 Tax=Fusarium proliferatum (strain ET1) TaxID=1227346 RepID=A0A1L7WAW7_FUSPR|nr:uncharacterized protein FPRO_15963 [Fusarium proliferatum ET1]CZR49605.1 uncharacterized protein FPRO_15963 [Fusarium proliferatum ET1]